jgi:cysteine desulfurase
LSFAVEPRSNRSLKVAVNVAGAVAMAAALQVTTARRSVEVARVARLRDRLLNGLTESIAGLFENGDRAHKVAGSCHVGIPGIEAEVLLVALDQAGLYAAAGSSCSSGATEPSHVLAAMGVPRADALSSIRLSLGFASTDADVDAALELVPTAVEELRRSRVPTR